MGVYCRLLSEVALILPSIRDNEFDSTSSLNMCVWILEIPQRGIWWLPFLNDIIINTILETTYKSRLTLKNGIHTKRGEGIRGLLTTKSNTCLLTATHVDCVFWKDYPQGFFFFLLYNYMCDSDSFIHIHLVFYQFFSSLFVDPVYLGFHL